MGQLLSRQSTHDTDNLNGSFADYNDVNDSFTGGPITNPTCNTTPIQQHLLASLDPRSPMNDRTPIQILKKKMSKRTVSYADGIENRAEYGGGGREKAARLTLPEELGDATGGREEFDLPEDDERRVRQEEQEEEEDAVKEKKHTLDSDEELEEDHRRLDMKKVEGEEAETLDFDGTQRITAFNMKEDMEEGHFDADGNFIFDKKDKEIKDAWLDNVDWAAIKQKAGKQWVDKEESDDDDLPLPTMTDERKKVVFEELLALLQPGQTVAKALSQLKKSKGLSAAEERKRRWAAKKAGTSIEESDDEKKTSKLSGLADEMINAGFMDAYEWTRERIQFLLDRVNPAIGEGLDMFSDEIPTLKKDDKKDVPSTSNAGAGDELDTVMWEYKEDDREATKIQGPFTSEEMAGRQQAGKLAAKGVARRLATAEFHPVARIDFEIYC